MIRKEEEKKKKIIKTGKKRREKEGNKEREREIEDNQGYILLCLENAILRTLTAIRLS